jgi:hypothetical protein
MKWGLKKELSGKNRVLSEIELIPDDAARGR